jgi:hypothetical protein
MIETLKEMTERAWQILLNKEMPVDKTKLCTASRL